MNDLALAAQLVETLVGEVPLFGATIMALLDEAGEMQFKIQCHGDSYRYQIYGLFEQAKMMIREYEEEEWQS